MEYRAFGRTGLDVSAIGFGCWEIGGGYGHFDESDVVKAVHRALDLGINLFDTAEGYGFGQSEEILGRALGTRRDEAIVVTKFGILQDDGKWYRDSSRESALAAIDRSLKALGTDYVDVYLIHWPDKDVPLEESMGALEEIVQAGKGPLCRCFQLPSAPDRDLYGDAAGGHHPVRLPYVRPPAGA